MTRTSRRSLARFLRPRRVVHAHVIDPVLDQVVFRGRNDDGTQTSATWKAVENTPWTQAVDENFRVRFIVDETAGGEPANQMFQLQYNLNGAGWNNVNATSAVVRSSASPGTGDSVLTTQQLTGGTGTFVAGRFDETDGLTLGVDLAVGGITELEFCVQILSADVVNADTVELRAISNTSGAFGLYTATPSITVSEAVPMGGAATGSFSFVGAATGSRVSQGSATGTDTWAGSATGAAPSGVSQGAATGTWTLSGSATGSKFTQGLATGTWSLAGSATGARASAGLASGTDTWAGSATGARVSAGSASGTDTWAGLATGSAPGGIPSGAVIGTWTFAGSATGARASAGSASGSSTWAGSATGSAPAVGQKTGLVLGAFDWSGSATGARLGLGNITGGWVFAGSATGVKPILAGDGAPVLQGAAVWGAGGAASGLIGAGATAAEWGEGGGTT